MCKMRSLKNWSMTILIFVNWNNVFVIGKRGPHHPRSEVDTGRHNKVDEHFSLETEHLQEDLHHHPTMPEQNVSEMSEEEKHFYYFKLHDTDDNNALDGLELLQAATHHNGDNHHNHHYNHQQGQQQHQQKHHQEQNPHEHHETNDIDQQNDIKTENLNENDIEANKHNELMHIINAVDDFIEYADVNQDGYLNYAEYTKAMSKVMEIDELQTQRNEVDTAELLLSTNDSDNDVNNNNLI